MEKRQRYPLNVPGDFYVENGMCIACTAPEREAPELMSHDPVAHAGYHCYFQRQPETAQELDLAISAVNVGCCGAVRYGGRNASVIRRLTALGILEACDCAADQDKI